MEAPGAVCAPVIGIEFFVDSQIENPPALTLLTAVEREVLEGLSLGATNRQIAEGRGTSPATVKNQVSEILRKFKMGRRSEVIAAQAAYRIQFPITAPSSDSSGTKGLGAQR